MIVREQWQRRPHDRRAVARSLGIGVFLGILPISFGAQVLAVLLPRWFALRTLPMLLGSMTSNPITFPPIVMACLWLGSWILGQDPSDQRILDFPGLQAGWKAWYHWWTSWVDAYLAGLIVIAPGGGVTAWAIARYASDRLVARTNSGLTIARPNSSHLQLLPPSSIPCPTHGETKFDPGQ